MRYRYYYYGWRWGWHWNPRNFGFAEFEEWQISDVYAGCGVFDKYEISANSTTSGLLKYPVPGDNSCSTIDKCLQIIVNTYQTNLLEFQIQLFPKYD